MDSGLADGHAADASGQGDGGFAPCAHGGQQQAPCRGKSSPLSCHADACSPGAYRLYTHSNHSDEDGTRSADANANAHPSGANTGSTASDAHGNPYSRAGDAHGNPYSRAGDAHGNPYSRAGDAHGNPYSCAGDAHGNPYSCAGDAHGNPGARVRQWWRQG